MSNNFLDSVMRYTLGLDSEWQVDQITMDTENQQIDVFLSHSGKHLVCPETGEAGTLYDHRKERSWRHLDWFQCKCFVHCRVPRIQSSSGIKTIVILWAEASSRMTYAFERWAIELLQATETKTAKLLRCGVNQIYRIMHRSVDRGIDRRSLDEISHIGIDEKAIKRGHVYATIGTDSTRGVVLDVGEGTTKKGTIELLEPLFEGIKDKIETVSSDMLKSFLGAIAQVVPKAALIHDRFHLIQDLNQAINKVRRREVKIHLELNGTRYVLLKNEENRTKQQDEMFKVLQASNLQVSLAWRLPEEFKGIFQCNSFAEAKEYFTLWLSSVEEMAVQEVINVAERFQRHFEGVCNALCHEQSNAKAERINGKIQEIKTVGRGYRTFENFRIAILFFCGGPDLLPQQSW
ncbi:MAG: ISL3 family transposase [Rhodothermaceae bacterium]|nr:ISL3 family transposase [Rhodothermaceae bacterium]MYE63848.1 ISL3 family transposase [Rhodothermaceae bacterium]MYJ19758.1 ISL3 family transposase [Rhodothermaceae bacterium]